jgi:PAS domain S-box-containing protein
MSVELAILSSSLFAATGLAVALYTALRRERARSSELAAELRASCDSLPIGVFHADNEGRCTYSNERAHELAGLEAPIGSAWITALHPDDRSRVVDRWMAAAAAGEVFRAEYRFLRPDGSVRWVAGEVRPRKDACGRKAGFVGTITDVTERKRVEAELERSRAEIEQRVADRTATLERANERLAREVAVRDRVELALARRRTLAQ